MRFGSDLEDVRDDSPNPRLVSPGEVSKEVGLGSGTPLTARGTLGALRRLAGTSAWSLGEVGAAQTDSGVTGTPFLLSSSMCTQNTNTAFW